MSLLTELPRRACDVEDWGLDQLESWRGDATPSTNDEASETDRHETGTSGGVASEGRGSGGGASGGDDSTFGGWLQHEPAGYVDGLNQYEYVGTNPVSNLDPLGLAGLKGHHLIPQSLWSGASDAVKAVWNSSDARIHNEFFNFHRYYTLNGVSHDTYNAAVRAELNRFLNGRQLSDLTKKEAEEFLERISKTRSGAIGKFNNGAQAQARTSARHAKRFLERLVRRGLISNDATIRGLISRAAIASHGAKGALDLKQRAMVRKGVKGILSKSAASITERGASMLSKGATLARRSARAVPPLFLLTALLADPLSMIGGAQAHAPTKTGPDWWELPENQDVLVFVEFTDVTRMYAKPKTLLGKAAITMRSIVEDTTAPEASFYRGTFLLPMRLGDAINGVVIPIDSSTIDPGGIYRYRRRIYRVAEGTIFLRFQGVTPVNTNDQELP